MPVKLNYLIYFILYLSTGTDWFSENELTDILSISNINNRHNNITGLLLYNNGNFIQLLEGAKDEVMKTFNRISLDRKHKSITLIASGDLAERNFPEWWMGFKAINSNSLKQIEGSFTVKDGTRLFAKDNHLGIKILKAFVRNARMNF